MLADMTRSFIATYVSPWVLGRDKQLQQKLAALRERDGDNCRRCRRPIRFDLPRGHDWSETVWVTDIWPRGRSKRIGRRAAADRQSLPDPRPVQRGGRRQHRRGHRADPPQERSGAAVETAAGEEAGLSATSRAGAP
jgi:hypothetical protein